MSKRGQEHGWEVSSAGTWTVDGLPPVQDAILEAKRLGLDIGGHQSRVVTAEMLREADLVLVMERGQKEALQIEFPGYRRKIALLSEVAGEAPHDITDPMKDPKNAGAGSEIRELIQSAFEKICARALEHSRHR